MHEQSWISTETEHKKIQNRDYRAKEQNDWTENCNRGLQ